MEHLLLWCNVGFDSQLHVLLIIKINKMKLEFSIRQHQEATAKKPSSTTEFNMVVSSRKELTREFVMEQIKSRVAELLRLRLVTKQTCGLNLSKPIEIVFQLGGQKINTAKISEKWNFKLKVANTKERRTTFYRTLEEIVDLGFKGDKERDRAQIDLDITAIVEEQRLARAQAKAARELAAVETSAN